MNRTGMTLNRYVEDPLTEAEIEQCRDTHIALRRKVFLLYALVVFPGMAALSCWMVSLFSPPASLYPGLIIAEAIVAFFVYRETRNVAYMKLLMEADTLPFINERGMVLRLRYEFPLVSGHYLENVRGEFRYAESPDKDARQLIANIHKQGRPFFELDRMVLAAIHEGKTVPECEMVEPC